MWKLFGKRDAPATEKRDELAALDSMISAINQGDVERPLPTLVCRECGLKYGNTGTYLKGSRCPDCHPNG